MLARGREDERTYQVTPRKRMQMAHQQIFFKGAFFSISARLRRRSVRELMIVSRYRSWF